jgi:hypothetical protein
MKWPPRDDSDRRPTPQPTLAGSRVATISAFLGGPDTNVALDALRSVSESGRTHQGIETLRENGGVVSLAWSLLNGRHLLGTGLA